MTEKEKLNSGLTLEPSRWVSLESVTKFINRHIPPKIKMGDDSEMLWAVKTGRREHAHPQASDLRMVVRIQRKNKHPHSTKKHK
jgi:hypothetical protein